MPCGFAVLGVGEQGRAWIENADLQDFLHTHLMGFLNYLNN